MCMHVDNECMRTALHTCASVHCWKLGMQGRALLSDKSTQMAFKTEAFHSIQPLIVLIIAFIQLQTAFDTKVFHSSDANIVTTLLIICKYGS